MIRKSSFKSGAYLRFEYPLFTYTLKCWQRFECPRTKGAALRASLLQILCVRISLCRVIRDNHIQLKEFICLFTKALIPVLLWLKENTSTCRNDLNALLNWYDSLFALHKNFTIQKHSKQTTKSLTLFCSTNVMNVFHVSEEFTNSMRWHARLK